MLDFKVRVTEKDSGWDKLARELEILATKKVRVGIQSESDTQLLIYANANEFGATIPVTAKMRGFFKFKFGVNLKKTIIKIPARPFMRQSFDKRFEELKEIGFDMAGLVMDDVLTLEQALINWGDQYISFIREEVNESTNFEPNAPFTLEQKGSGKHPLQDSGRLMQALKAVVK